MAPVAAAACMSSMQLRKPVEKTDSVEIFITCNFNTIQIQDQRCKVPFKFLRGEVSTELHEK